MSIIIVYFMRKSNDVLNLPSYLKSKKYEYYFIKI